MRRLRNALIGGTAAAMLAAPLLPATPAAAQDYDCEMHAPFDPVEEAIECVRYIIVILIDDPLV